MPTMGFFNTSRLHSIQGVTIVPRESQVIRSWHIEIPWTCLENLRIWCKSSLHHLHSISITPPKVETFHQPWEKCGERTLVVELHELTWASIAISVPPTYERRWPSSFKPLVQYPHQQQENFNALNAPTKFCTRNLKIPYPHLLKMYIKLSVGGRTWTGDLNPPRHETCIDTQHDSLNKFFIEINGINNLKKKLLPFMSCF